MASGKTGIEEYTVEEYEFNFDKFNFLSSEVWTATGVKSDCGISITAIVDARVQFVGISPAA